MKLLHIATVVAFIPMAALSDVSPTTNITETTFDATFAATLASSSRRARFEPTATTTIGLDTAPAPHAKTAMTCDEGLEKSTLCADTKPEVYAAE